MVVVKGIFVTDTGNSFICAKQTVIAPTEHCPATKNENYANYGSDYVVMHANTTFRGIST